MNTPNQKPNAGVTGSKSNNTIAVGEAVQGGFDFWDATEAPVIEQPVGTWECRIERTAAQYLASIEAAENSVLIVQGPARAIFNFYLLKTRESLAWQVERQCYEEAEVFSLWGARFKVPCEMLTAFAEHCRTHAGCEYGPVKFKARKELDIETLGMHVEGVGTVIFRDWGLAGQGSDFSLMRADRFFLESYADARPVYELPYSAWHRGSICQRLSESGDGVCSVPTFSHLGRDFVVTGSTHGKDRREGDAWVIAPLCDWKGKTYSYRSQIEAYNAGVLQRGDHRGLLVKVRGELCVLESAALVSCASSADDFKVIDEDEDGTPDDDGVEFFNDELETV